MKSCVLEAEMANFTCMLGRNCYESKFPGCNYQISRDFKQRYVVMMITLVLLLLAALLVNIIYLNIKYIVEKFSQLVCCLLGYIIRLPFLLFVLVD